MARESYASTQAKIQKEIDKLKKKQALLIARERGPAIDHIVDLMKALSITPAELATALEKGGSARRRGRPKQARAEKTPKRELPPKYRDPVSGKTWSGMGRTPFWIVEADNKGVPRDQFLIQH